MTVNNSSQPNQLKKDKSSLTNEQRKLFDILVEDKLDDWRTYSKRTNIGIWKSVIEKYPETAHFIYELIQNADDALASEVTIFLFKDKLVFKHNGKRQFSITDAREQIGVIGDINSITSVACSTKKDEEHTIGKFGVGFKSVFQYTDVPSIYDDTFWFKIENYMVPILLDSDHKLRQPGETLFEIPFKNPEKAYSEILDRLQNLNMPTLFLPHVKIITWKVDSSDEVHEYSKKELQSNERYGIKYELCRIHDYKQSQLLYLFHRDCTTSEGAYNIGVGYFLNSDGSLDVQTKRKIYCFFPTSETFDSCFVSHAPFLLTDNRDRIKEFENVNKEFLHGIEELAADALLCLRDIGICRNAQMIEERNKSMISKQNLLLTDNLFHILNIESTTERNVDLKQCFFDKIREERLLLNRSLDYVSPSEVYSTTKELESLLSSTQLHLLCENNNIDFLYQKGYRSDFKEDIKKSLNISLFGNKSLACCLTSSFMDEQPIEWANRLLTYIEENATKLWKVNGVAVRDFGKNYWGQTTDSWKDLKFRFASIVRTQNGEWVAPYTLLKKRANVCLPYKGFEDAGENTFGKVIDNDFFKKHEAFFRGIDLKEPDIADYIEKTLLVRYENDRKLSEEVLLKDFKLIYNLVHGQNNTKLVEVLKQKWRLKVIGCIDTTLCKIEALNIPNETFVTFVKGNSAVQFVDCAFYAEGLGLSREEVKNFLTLRFCMRSLPKVISIINSYWRWSSEQNFPQEVLEFLNNSYLSKSYTPEFEDYFLEGYNIRNCTAEWSHCYWKIIIKNGVEKYALGTLKYSLYRERYSHEKSFESTYLSKLKNDKWIVKDNGTTCRPSEISLYEFHQLGYEENQCIEKVLGFLDDVLAEKKKEEKRIADEKERSEHDKYLKEISDKNIDNETLKAFICANDKGVNVEDLLNLAISVQDKGVPINDMFQNIVCAHEEGINVMTSLNHAISEKKEVDSIDNSIQIDGTKYLHNKQTISNVSSLLDIANKVGDENFPYVAENIDSFMHWLDDEEKLPSMVRRIVSYIGKKIYEQYLISAGEEYEVINDEISCGDFNIGNGEKYVSVISTLKTISDNKIPIGITAAQNVFLRSHPNVQIRIVRISLKDIMVIPQYEHIVAIYGKEDEPNMNDRLRKQCDELAENYWKGADIAEFDAVSPEYSIKIERKLRK